jgi:nucleotide-binding universal stress UspA family protein
VTSPSRHVAVAVDFGAASQRALDEAQSLASGAGDRITLIHVVPGFSGGMPPHYYRYGQAEYQRGLMQDARERVRQIVAEMRTVATVDAKVLVGDTATEISRVVSGIGADLLVVGLPRRGLVSRAVFGATAGRLWTKLTVPMLAVPEMTAAASLQTAA